jgi:lactoylglutathione lyase
MRLNYAIVFVSDMAESVAFYRDVLGLELRFESPGWSEFVTGDATLALHSSEKPGALADSPSHPPAGRCRPGLATGNLDEFHTRMLQHNVSCLQEPKNVFGVRIAQYLDPNGLALSVSEERRPG